MQSDISKRDKRIEELTIAIVKLKDRIQELKAQVDLQSKRIDWTVADNVKKALEIEELTRKLEGVTSAYEAEKKLTATLRLQILGQGNA